MPVFPVNSTQGKGITATDQIAAVAVACSLCQPVCVLPAACRLCPFFQHGHRHRSAHTHLHNEITRSKVFSTDESTSPLQRQLLKLLLYLTFVTHTAGDWQVPHCTPELCGFILDPSVTFKGCKNDTFWTKDIQLTAFPQSKNGPSPAVGFAFC